MSKRIEKLLRKALIQDGAMEYALYEHELVEHIDYWYKGLLADRNEFVFAVTENSGDTAMVLITKEKDIYVNEAAREQLCRLWGQEYKPNYETPDTNDGRGVSQRYYCRQWGNNCPLALT